jgi:predicted nucleotidyltransferase
LWPRRKQAYQTLQRGIDRNELPAGSDLDLVLDSLYGPIYMRFLIRHDKLDESFADEICALVLQGLKRSVTLGLPVDSGPEGMDFNGDA